MKKLFAVIALVAASITSAFAAVPLVVGTSLTAVQTDSLAVIDLLWPVVLAILGGFVLIKIVKRGIRAL